jgi:hypothetical protein
VTLRERQGNNRASDLIAATRYRDAHDGTVAYPDGA